MSPKNTVHQTGIPIAALDISPHKTHAVLAGRDILKTIQVSGSACVEDFNLRSVIIAYTATHDTLGKAVPAKHKDQLAANDVKWSHGRFDTTICTAAANGQIVVYDLTRAGVEFARLHEHVRQVHRVAFNPHQGALLLSGSQDATMRLWDLRDLAGDRSVMTCRSSYQYPGNNEGIRDLRWSPTNGVEFAAGTDNGVIQRWDFRKARAPILKVNAHEKTCHSIDWHPDGKHLMSGGADKLVNVWDFSSTDRRKKACWQLRAPQAVLNVRWRPPHGAGPSRGLGDWQCSQIVTSYDHQDPRIHLWDFRRPYVPFREIDCYDTAPTAMLWRSEDLLWSVGNQGVFAQTDINLATQVSDTRSASLVAIAPSGQIGFFSEKRSRRHRSLHDATESFLNQHRNPSGGSEKMSRSHSATDGSFEEASLLSSSFKNRHRKPASTRSSKSMAGTPPSAGTGVPMVNLEEVMQKEYMFQPAQSAAYGHILGLFDPAAFAYLARNYESPPVMSSNRRTEEWARTISRNLESNARLAARIHRYQLAQSWRILGLAVAKEFPALATIRSRKRHSRPTSVNLGKRSNHGKPRSEAGHTGKDDQNATSTSEITKQRREVATPQTLGHSSNVTTPMVRPIADKSDRLAGSECSSSPRGEDYLSLPAPGWGDSLGDNHTNGPSDSAGLSDGLRSRGIRREAVQEENEFRVAGSSLADGMSLMEMTDVQVPLTGFADFESHLSERRAAMANYQVTPRPLLRLEESVHNLPGNMMFPTQRHDSPDRLQLSSSSTRSPRRMNSITCSSESSQRSEKMEMAPGPRDTLTRHGEAHGASLEKSILNKDPICRTLEDSLSPLFDAVGNHDHMQPRQSPVNLGRTRGLRSPPLVRSSQAERTIIHYEDIDDSCEESDMGKDMDIIPKNEKLDEEEALGRMTDTRPWAAHSIIDTLITYHTTELCCSQLPANVLLQLGSLSSSITPALALSILLSYHAQLTSLSLYVQAAHLRNQAYPLYPDVSEHGSYGISSGGPWCAVCRKPSKGNRRQFCQRCNQPWADCPICDGEGAVAVSHGNRVRQSDSLWGWCQWCGHGGHLGCLRTWWDMSEASEGGCATTGCLHDCVGGARREEVHKEKAAAKRGSTVKGDDWVVGESRAVERTRSMVFGTGEDGGSQGAVHHASPNAKSLQGAQGPLSLGMMGRSGSGGKKVRLLVPIHDGDGSVGLEGGDGDGGNGTSASAP